MDILNKNEYTVFYQDYINALSDKNLSLLEYLEQSAKQADDLLGHLTKVQQDFRYAGGKWSVKEIVQHLIDAERILAYRALRFARFDKTELSGYDEDYYVAHAFCGKSDFKSLLGEMKIVRQSTVLLFKNFDQEVLLNSGVANANKMSVRAIGYIISGHQLHHLKVIKERYLQTFR